jgi:hypothetical protein
MRSKNKILITILTLSLFLFSNCIKWDPADARKTPTNSKERAKKNVKEGRGVSINSVLKGRKGSGNYEFSTSNPMWRATLDTLDFIPFSTVDYSGGLVITDWYSDGANRNESLKITVRFLSNEIQSNSLKISVYQRICSKQNNCSTKIIDSKIKKELVRTILTSAAILEKESKKKK